MGNMKKIEPASRRASPQKRAFIEAACAAEVDEDEGRWEQRLKAVAKPPVKPKKRKD
jgi:hypothetical protein